MRIFNPTTESTEERSEEALEKIIFAFLEGGLIRTGTKI